MRLRTPFVLTALLLCASLAQASKPKLYTPTDTVDYPVVAAPSRLPLTVSIEATYEPDAELLATWKTKKIKDDAIEKHRQAVVAAITRDISSCGLFENVVAPGDPAASYKAKFICQTVQSATTLTLKVTAEFTRTADGVKEWTFVHAMDLGPAKGPHEDFSFMLRPTMIFLRGDISQGVNQKLKQEKEKAQIAAIHAASLAELLVASDPNTNIARERNRAIVAAKNAQLPAILREKKTEELSALVTKIEQTILDLDHEAELAKDKAQDSAANGATARGGGDGGRPMPDQMITRARGFGHAANQGPSLDELRDLSISYRERIELLKPIAAAIKDEIANRNR